MLIANILGLILIGGIIWWFWLSQSTDASRPREGSINIIVENGIYSPSRVLVPVNKPTTLRFIRKDPSPCSQTVIFNGLDISVDLPLDEPREIVITPPQKGLYEFTCQMQMYKGTLDVVDGG